MNRKEPHRTTVLYGNGIVTNIQLNTLVRYPNQLFKLKFKTSIIIIAIRMYTTNSINIITIVWQESTLHWVYVSAGVIASLAFVSATLGRKRSSCFHCDAPTLDLPDSLCPAVALLTIIIVVQKCSLLLVFLVVHLAKRRHFSSHCLSLQLTEVHWLANGSFCTLISIICQSAVGYFG